LNRRSYAHVCPDEEHFALIRQPNSSPLTFKKSQRPPAEDVARLELITMWAGSEVSQGDVSDQDPMKESSILNADPELSASSVVKAAENRSLPDVC
jgi:hypothetical protein